MGQANSDQTAKKYDNAIFLYNTAYTYYSAFHYSEENQKYYFEIPYKVATCYLAQNDKSKSVESMLHGITSVQHEYGIFSKQTADFMRKYLIEYYLDNNNVKLAQQEFDNLILIYKKIGYSASEAADLIRISGDIYYQLHRYDLAMELYSRSYKELRTVKKIDYDIFVKLVSRIANYQIQTGREQDAIDLYKTTINTLEQAGKKQNKNLAYLLLQLGDLYLKKDMTQDSIRTYERAIFIIRKLPNTNYMKQNLSVYLTTLKEQYDKAGQYHKVREIDMEFARKRRFSIWF